jgi:hypothetical protein
LTISAFLTPVPSITIPFMLSGCLAKSLLCALTHTIDLSSPYTVDSDATKENARRCWPASP